MYHLFNNNQQLLVLIVAALLSVFVTGITGYSVVGNKLYDPSGAKVQVRGVCRPSFEWNAQGEDASSSDYALMKNMWGANVVRIALNQDFWLAGASYATTIDQQIAWITKLNMGVILDLHWNNGGQQNMADRNSITFWKSVATRYKNNAWVMFELYNEPHDVSHAQWLSGDSQYAGMQEMYDAVRSVGASNVVIVGGLNWAFDLSGVGAKGVNGVKGTNIAYATHPYDFDGKQIGNWAAGFGFLAADFPVIMTEFGQYCATNTYVADLLNYAETLGIHWTAWAWFVSGCAFPSIISDWNGTPYPGVGETVKRYMSGQVQTPVINPGSTKAPTAAPTTSPATANLKVYASGVSSSFEDWSWASNYVAADTQFVRAGATSSIKFEVAKYGGAYYHAKTNFVASSYYQLVFYVNGGTATQSGSGLSVKLYSTSNAAIGQSINLPVNAAANTWTQVSIPISSFQLSASTLISGVAIQANVDASSGFIWVADISFVPVAGSPPTSAPPVAATTRAPTPAPTKAPTAPTTPTVAPTKAPTAPTKAPTVAPSAPTAAPTKAPTTGAPSSGSCGAANVKLAQTPQGSWQASGKTVSQYNLEISHNCSGKKIVGLTLTASNWNTLSAWNVVANGASLTLPAFTSIPANSAPYIVGYQSTVGQASFTISSVTFQ